MRITVDSMSLGPDGVGRVDGKVYFVAGGIVGDVVEATEVSSGKSFSKAVVDEVLEPSALRTVSPCPYSSVCGGCPWAQLDYAHQLTAKRKNLIDVLTRIGKFVPDEAERLVGDVVSPSEPWGYRNKVELAVVRDADGGFQLGMHGVDPERVVRVDKCLLLDKKHQKMLKGVAGAIGYLGRSRDLGLERVGLRASARTGQTEVALWTDPAAFPRAEVAKVLHDGVKASSVVRVMTKGPLAARKIAGIETLDGLGFWGERIAGRKMRVCAPSFFQVNTAGAERLVELVLSALEPHDGDLVADLYCGAGTFTLPIAAAGAEVIAVESYGPAVRDLNRNLVECGLDDMVETVGDETERQLDAIEDVDAIVVDPPRSGLDPSVVDALVASPAKRIVYVSCDPATLARDLARILSHGEHQVSSITPVDLFPQSYHVETVVLLTRSE